MAEPVRLQLMLELRDKLRTSTVFSKTIYDYAPEAVEEADGNFPVAYLYDFTEAVGSPQENQATNLVFNQINIGLEIFFQYGATADETKLVVGNRLLAEAQRLIAEFERDSTITFDTADTQNEIQEVSRADHGVVVLTLLAQYWRQRLDPTSQ